MSYSRVDPVAPPAAEASVPATFDVVVTRGSLAESHHRVHVAVVDHTGAILHTARDPHYVTWWRSCAKPFQLLPFLESGGVDALGWGDDEIALACASHGGEPEHVAIAGKMLSSIGLEEGDLACGPHEPLSARGSRLLRECGGRPTRLHNNCSGKHAAMLAFAKHLEVSTTGYEQAGHPVQQRIRRTLHEWCGLAPSQMLESVDGCGAVVFGLPLYNMALSYAQLAASSSAGPASRIVGAMLRSPFLVGGTDRFDTVLMEAGEGRIVCKIGAEGVHTIALLERNIGIAVKVEDGNPRAQYPAIMAVLAHLDTFPRGLPDSLREYALRPVRNTRGETVGEITLATGNLS